MPSRFRIILERIIAAIRRNPSARADALELAAASLRERAKSTSQARAERMVRRADLFALRARQLRGAP